MLLPVPPYAGSSPELCAAIGPPAYLPKIRYYTEVSNSLLAILAFFYSASNPNTSTLPPEWPETYCPSTC